MAITSRSPHPVLQAWSRAQRIIILDWCIVKNGQLQNTLPRFEWKFICTCWWWCARAGKRSYFAQSKRGFSNPSIIIFPNLFGNDGSNEFDPVCKKRREKFATTLLIDFSLKQQKILGLLLFQDVSNCWVRGILESAWSPFFSAKLHYYLNCLNASYTPIW